MVHQFNTFENTVPCTNSVNFISDDVNIYRCNRDAYISPLSEIKVKYQATNDM